MLKYLCIIIVILVGNAAAKAAFPVPKLAASCAQRSTRRDITTLSPTELSKFFNAVREMHHRGWLDGFGSMHDHISNQIHGNEQFFAWHRRFLRHFESLLQQIDPDVVLPYWNWAKFWQNPMSDPVLSSAYFGTNGRPGDNCVVDGIQARWGHNYPTRNCLTRKFRYGTSTGSFWPMRAVRDVMSTSKTHAQFRSRIENGAHGIVHLGLGGDFETMWAPVDVLFFLHHTMIDKIWAEWQTKDPARYLNIDGYDHARQALSGRSLMPFYNEDISSTLVTTDPGYCYVYDDLPAPVVPARRGGLAFHMGVNATSEAEAEPLLLSPEALLAVSENRAPGSEQGAPEQGEENSADADSNYEPPLPMGRRWMLQRNMNIEEAERMQELVNSVVALMNAERRSANSS
ncbi:hypothetical protein GGI12_000691 [Dipsacomyces acuminosporus]|nr:hypothetical protein GGI12_000691 [Dipsacomyces acuminosporus]